MRLALVLVVVIGAGAASVAYAAFSSASSVGSSSFSASSSFCVSPGTQSATDTADTDVGEDKNPPSPATNTTAQVKGAAPKRRRAYIFFTLPSLPHNCTVTSATMTLTVTQENKAGTMDVVRAAGSWCECTIAWSSQPGFTGSAVSTAIAGIGSYTWNVTSLVQALYSGSNYGFVVLDDGDYVSGNGSMDETISTREGTSPPRLSITFGG